MRDNSWSPQPQFLGRAEGQKSKRWIFNFPLNKEYIGVQGNIEFNAGKDEFALQNCPQKLNSSKPTTGSNWCKKPDTINNKFFCTLLFLRGGFGSLGNFLTGKARKALAKTLVQVKKYHLETDNFLILN